MSFKSSDFGCVFCASACEWDSAMSYCSSELWFTPNNIIRFVRPDSEITMNEMEESEASESLGR